MPCGCLQACGTLLDVILTAVLEAGAISTPVSKGRKYGPMDAIELSKARGQRASLLAFQPRHVTLESKGFSPVLQAQATRRITRLLSFRLNRVVLCITQSHTCAVNVVSKRPRDCKVNESKYKPTDRGAGP